MKSLTVKSNKEMYNIYIKQDILGFLYLRLIRIWVVDQYSIRLLEIWSIYIYSVTISQLFKIDSFN